ncbi:MAG TPA: CoA-binding protein [Candidatus Methanoperedenaceae archaeon]|nr:CoA-binding protein [Candidatus Methanoperedenaceae archaeon]
MSIIHDGRTDDEIRGLLRLRNIAVVGLSSTETKPSHFVAKYLKEQGYSVICVNPTIESVFGGKCYRSLLDVPVKIDVADVFRRSEDMPPVAKEAIKAGARVLWMQEGIYSREAAEEAARNGLTVVWNRCMMKEHRRLIEG